MSERPKLAFIFDGLLVEEGDKLKLTLPLEAMQMYYPCFKSDNPTLFEQMQNYYKHKEFYDKLHELVIIMNIDGAIRNEI